jgi:eukaryotic-like serine/threonine-protein kinase
VFRGRFACCPRDGTSLIPADDDDPLVGHILAERYRIEELLGEGGMGRVYRAQHVRMSRRFAIKVLFGDLAGDPKIVARFSREAEAASRLSHPNVVGVVDFGETGEGLLYLAMDFADGPNLGHVIDTEGPLGDARARALAEQIADGLDHAHRRGLVHRDLKPDNIVVDRGQAGEVARVLDFGIAVLRDQHAAGERLTTDGLVVGTPHYMAPEQAMNEALDHRVDLFAFGVILYEMLAGTLPFDGTPAEIARSHIARQAPRVARRTPGVTCDPLLEALAFRLMAKRPADRPESARDVAECLRAIANDRDAAARWLRVEDGFGLRAPTPLPVPADDGAAPAPPAVRQRDTVPSRPGITPQRSEAEPPSPPPATTETDLAPRRRRGPVVAIAAAVLALAAVVGVVATRGSHGGGAADAGAAPVAAAPPDAAALAQATPPDAGTDAPGEVPLTGDADLTADAGALVAPRPRRPDAGVRHVVHHRPDAAPRVVHRAPPDAAPARTIDRRSLTARYTAVGRALEALVRDKGEGAAVALKRRYLAVPYADALGNPALRAQVEHDLAALAADVARARR